MSMVVFLNGPGSSGKTTIARAIQNLDTKPWLLLSMDNFIEMLPEQYMAFGDRADEGYFSFRAGLNDHGPTISVDDGPLAPQVFGLMPVFARELADQGNNLIIDEVLFGDDCLKKYVKVLHSHTVYFMGVFCDLEVMQQREQIRGDRLIGLSNDQIDRVHAGLREYDLKVDTTHKSADVAAQEILTFIEETPNPQGFRKLRSHLPA